MFKLDYAIALLYRLFHNNARTLKTKCTFRNLLESNLLLNSLRQILKPTRTPGIEEPKTVDHIFDLTLK